MAKITKSDLLAQRITNDLVKNGIFSKREDAMKFARSAIADLRKGFTKPLAMQTLSQQDQDIMRWRNAFKQASSNWTRRVEFQDYKPGQRGKSQTTKLSGQPRQLGNTQVRIWLEQLEAEAPKHVKDDPEIKRMKGLATRNTKGGQQTQKITRVDLGKGTEPAKNIDTTDMQRVRDLRAQQKQRQATTTKTAGLDPSKAPKNLQTAPTQTYPSTTQTPSSAPSRQGQMLKRAEMTDPAGIAETKYEKELMDVARKEGKKGLQNKLEADTGVKHSKKSMGAIWKEFKKAIKFGEGTGGIPIGGPSKGGSSPAKNLTGGKLGINDHIKLL
jgi:hypothetical protein